jgi:hypothetical protein
MKRSHRASVGLACTGLDQFATYWCSHVVVLPLSEEASNTMQLSAGTTYLHPSKIWTLYVVLNYVLKDTLYRYSTRFPLAVELCRHICDAGPCMVFNVYHYYTYLFICGHYSLSYFYLILFYFSFFSSLLIPQVGGSSINITHYIKVTHIRN